MRNSWSQLDFTLDRRVEAENDLWKAIQLSDGVTQQQLAIRFFAKLKDDRYVEWLTNTYLAPLSRLRDSGLLSEDEFASKFTETLLQALRGQLS